jgi:hypothetical protein
MMEWRRGPNNKNRSAVVTQYEKFKLPAKTGVQLRQPLPVIFDWEGLNQSKESVKAAWRFWFNGTEVKETTMVKIGRLF